MVLGQVGVAGDGPGGLGRRLLIIAVKDFCRLRVHGIDEDLGRRVLLSLKGRDPGGLISQVVEAKGPGPVSR